MPLTVAIDSRLYDRQMTGDTSYWRGLINALTSQNRDARFLLYSNTPRPQEIPESENVQWRHVPGKDRWWSLVAFPLAARRARANVIHTQYNLSPLAGRHGVTTIHDVSFIINPVWYSFKDWLVLRTQVPASAKRAARVITVSETSKKDIEEWIPAAKGKIRVTYNALGDNIQPMAQEQAQEVVANLQVPTPYLLTVGTRWPRKNMALAIDAAGISGQPVVVAGKQGWSLDALGAHYTGYVDDHQVTALYQCAQLYLAPSHHEGFGIPLLEAFACRCPVLCSNGGALPEVAGDAASVMKTFKPEAWADRIKELLADPAHLDDLRTKGTQRLKAFSWQETAAKTMDVYREAAQ